MKNRVRKRQDPLRQRYRTAPSEAWIVDRARTEDGVAQDPFHGTLVAGEGPQEWRVGIHRALGGDHDQPNPGDILCAALAGCFDTTFRILAARLDVPLEALSVEVQGEVDARGTLAVDRSVPVGFQRLTCRLHVRPARGVSSHGLKRLTAAAERACVVLQTLRHGVSVHLERAGEGTAGEGARNAVSHSGEVRA